MSIFKSEKIEKSLGVVLDVLFALVLLFSLFMTVSTLAQRENGVAGHGADQGQYHKLGTSLGFRLARTGRT